MASFPVLASGAVAQYPAERAEGFSTNSFLFVDGQEQHSAEYAAPLKRWFIRLDKLSEDEMFRLEEFFLGQGGASGSFSFTDPWDGVAYPNCSFDSDEIELVFEAPGRGVMAMVIKENR